MRDFHFVFGLAPQTSPLHVLHYLCLASCFATQSPSAVHLHYRHEPHGEWWERIAPRLVLHRIEGVTQGHARERYAATGEGRYIVANGLTYAHEADFLRLAILAAHGGAYADMDTLFVARYPDAWFDDEFVIGEESPHADARGIMRPSLCNAVMLARPGARFAVRWLERMTEVFDGTWSRHSCDEAGRLWFEDLPLTVLPRRLFYAYDFTRADLAALLERDDGDRPGVLSIHLWAHLWWAAERVDFTRVHAGLLTPEAIARGDTTYTRLARRFLP